MRLLSSVSVLSTGRDFFVVPTKLGSIASLSPHAQIARATRGPASSVDAQRPSQSPHHADYLRGALVLGSSIRSFDSSRDMVCLVTKAVPAEWRGALSVAGWTVREVDEVREFWWDKSSECSKFDADQAERWGHMATKLRLWQLTQYERIMYLDADTVLTGARRPPPRPLSSGGRTLRPLPPTSPPTSLLGPTSPPAPPSPAQARSRRSSRA